jgi:hypothetical protein
MQVNIKVRLLQLDHVVFEVEQAAVSPEMGLPHQEESIVYIPPPTTNVQTVELWYEHEANKYCVPRTTF